MASWLPEELVLEILVRLPLDLASASLVCKTWRRVISDRDSFWRRCREFHRAPPPPLLGYIENPYYGRSPMRFVHTMPSIACPAISKPAVDCSGWCALDCRHGRLLILDAKGDLSKRLIVWDPITGSLQHIGVPSDSYGSYPIYSYRGAVLCAKDGCDHLDCHGGPFHVVLVVANRAGRQFAIATTKYSSLTSAWGAPTLNHRSDYRVFSANGKHSLLIGDVLYFPYGHGESTIIRYDLHALKLSDIYLPQHLYGAILMEAEDGELGLATLEDNCIYLWSQQDIPNVPGLSCLASTRWVEHRVIMLGTNVPRQVLFESYKVIGFAEGTNTIFINISSGIFILDLETEKATKVGERKKADRDDPILPYMSFYVPRLPNIEHVKLEAELVVKKRANTFVRTYLSFQMLGWVKTLCNAG